MRVLLIDDEELQLIRLKTAIKKVLPEDTVFFCYINPVQALQEIAGVTLDIAFVDIEMPVISGIQLAKKLKETNPKVNIIFVTAYEHYAKNAYALHASGYITKPVNEEKVREEMENLRYPVEIKKKKSLQIKCFGNFEVFADGVPVKFQYSKSKELFAYLVDREGAAISINELSAVLWSEDHKSYLRNLIADIQATLEAVGAGEVFVKRSNPDAILTQRTEYMKQYSWLTF